MANKWKQPDNPPPFLFIDKEEQDLSIEPLEETRTTDMSDFDFVDHYGEEEEVANEDQLPDNETGSSLNCAVIGVGGGGGKMAKAFLDIGFNKTLLINTTAKDIPPGVGDEHVVLIPDADGIGKDVNLGKAVFDANSAVVEDALRTKLGNVDWLIVMAGLRDISSPPRLTEMYFMLSLVPQRKSP